MSAAPMDLPATAPILAEWFGVPSSGGLVLAALFAADTVPLTRPQIAERTGLSPHAVEAATVRLRTAVEADELVTDGRRWALTEAGCADCLRALADAESRRTAA